MFSCLFYQSPLLSVIRYNVWRKKDQWRHQNYGIILKKKEILTQEHQQSAKNIPVIPRFSRLRRSPLARARSPNLMTPFRWSRSGQNHIIKTRWHEIDCLNVIEYKMFQMITNKLTERTERLYWSCTDLLRLCTKRHFSGDQETSWKHCQEWQIDVDLPFLTISILLWLLFFSIVQNRTKILEKRPIYTKIRWA